MISARTLRTVLVISAAGFAMSFALLLPLPNPTDISAARRWGVGAGYVSFFLGFPLSMVTTPLLIGVRPFPAGNDLSGALLVAAAIAVSVAVDWAIVVLCLANAVLAIRAWRARPVAQPSVRNPPNER